MTVFEDLVDVLESVRPYEGYIAARCIFHDDRSPSLLVYEDGWYNCQACGAHGRNEYLYQEALGRPPTILKNNVRYQIPSYPKDPRLLHKYALSCHNELHAVPHLGYFWIHRGVEDSIRPCKLGHMNGWYTIPVFGEEGFTQGVVFRAGMKLENPIAKYFNTAGAPPLYIPRWELLDQKLLFITYGMIDAIVISQLGFAACTSTTGKMGLNIQAVKDLGVPEMVLIPDLGEEGEAMRDREELGARASILYLPYLENDHKDPADFMQYDNADKLRRELERYG